MSLPLILSLLAVGTGAGFLAGLLGIGGGMVMVPFLMMIFTAHGIGAGQLVKVAIATSLATILFTSVSSVRAHWRAGAVRWDVVKLLASGIVIGAIAGAHLAGLLSPQLLESFFALFVSYSATQMLRARTPSAADGAETRLPGALSMFGVGGLIGVLSALVGAGGGFLTVPFLTSRRVPIQSAIATSAACGFPIAMASAVGYAWAGRDLDLGPGMLGYIYLPGLLCVAAASVLTASWGARTAHRWPVSRLKRVFAVMLYSLAAYMLYRAVAGQH